MNLHDIQAYLAGPWLLAALTGLGFAVGIVTGLFGVGGAFMITPLLKHLLGIPYSLAVGSSLSFTLGSSSAGWVRHVRLGNVSWKTMFILGGCAVGGTYLGAWLHDALKAAWPAHFDRILDGVFIGILLLVAALVAFGRRSRVEEGPGPRSLLQWLPIAPNIHTRSGGLEDLSLPGMIVLGAVMGVVPGLIGIGGGVLFMPILILAVGLTMHKAVGTSLGVVLFCGLTGAILYGGKGEANLWIVMSLLLGASLGVQLGAWLCQKLHAARLQRYFAVLVCCVVVYIGIEFTVKLLGGGGGEPAGGKAPLSPLWIVLLVTVPLAWGLGMAYLFEWFRHCRRKRRGAAGGD